MQSFNLPTKNKLTILALGAESAGNFSVYIPSSPFSKGGSGGFLYFSSDFGDLLIDANYSKFKSSLSKFLGQEKIKPDVVLTDLHPLYKTTLLGQELAKKYNARHIQVQHHLAHIFSAVGENMICAKSYKLKPKSYGIALDGTGYGLDEKIWGGEIFALRVTGYGLRVTRLGHLENQTMLGGDLAVKEPARMLIAILDKTYENLSLRSAGWRRSNPVICATKPEIATVIPRRNSLAMTQEKKDFIYQYVKKYYTRNQFEVLYNQLQSGFNCQETSSTGRVLDAVSIFLGFCGNERNFKHEPTILLEQNSTNPYSDLKPKIKKSVALPLWKRGLGGFGKPSITYQLDTTYLFKYLFKYVHRDKYRLAATAQLYIAQGLHEIAKTQNTKAKSQIFLAGGIANNKIISDYLISKGAIVNQKIPRGDAGISFGQIIYFLLQK